MLTGHQIIVKRNIFYRKFHRVNVVIFFILLFGIGVNLYVYRVFSKDKLSPAYFLTDKSGVYINDIPLDQTIYSDEDVAQWTQNSLEKVFSINYVNYRHQLVSASELFTPTGFRQYIGTLSASNNIEAVLANKYTVVSSFLESMTVQRRVLRGQGDEQRVLWVLQGKVRHYYLNALNLEEPFSQDLELFVIVARESFRTYENGVGIAVIIGEGS